MVRYMVLKNANKKAIILVLFILFCCKGLYSQNEVLWRPDSKLKWSDFLGRPDSSTEFGALSYTVMDLKAHSDGLDKMTYTVTAIFDKNQSWVRLRSEVGLQHEQGHFNITEIYTRKFRAALAAYKLKTSTFESDINRLFNKIDKERKQMQHKYDHETDFSRNVVMQNFWTKKIDRELKDLSEWAYIP